MPIAVQAEYLSVAELARRIPYAEQTIRNLMNQGVLRLDVHYVYSSHWVAYRLAFEANERIIGVKSNWGGLSWDGTQAQLTPATYTGKAAELAKRVSLP